MVIAVVFVNSSAWILFIQLDTSEWIYIIHFCGKKFAPVQYQSLNILSYQAIIFPTISGMLSALYSSRQIAGVIGRSRKFHLFNDCDCPEINYVSSAEATPQQKISRGEK
jgi:hypothetical protein